MSTMILNQIKSNFAQAQDLLAAFVSDPQTWANMAQAGELMVRAIHSGHKILSCGNGGSLCDAMHFAEELTGRFQQDRRPLAAFALSDASHITCVANDFGLDYIFSRSVEALGKPGDVLLAISTSGNSLNVIHAVAAAHKNGMQVVGLTGKTGGQMAGMCDVEIRAPYSEYSDRAQEIHIKVIHSLVEYIELSLKR